MYIACTDAGQPMFSKPLVEWTPTQIELLSWCRYYNGHYFSVPEEEKCSDKIFKYNVLFDKYIQEKEFKKKEAARKQRMQSKGKGTSYKWNLNG